MNKKKTGFTLIELIAVIVILAIIALIAIPTIMNIINNARKQSFINGVQGIIKAGDLYYSNKGMMGEMLEEVTFEFPNNIGDLQINGSLPKEGSMMINEEGEIALAASDGKYCVRKSYNEAEVVFDVNINDCYVYEDEEINEAFPAIKNGMIPVTIAEDGTVKKSHPTSKWHSYSEKIWANAVTVTEETRQKYEKANISTEIKEEDILTYLVWIPRYKYKLWYVDLDGGSYSGKGIDTSKVHSIDILFENKLTDKSNGTCNGTYDKATNGCYLTHPAFTFGEDELNGIWVGKYETGYRDATLDTEAQVDTTNSNMVIIKSNAYSWTNINISNAFYTVKGMNAEGNIFGLAMDSDTHMMKNTEWGAVAYLSHSKYGTCTEGVCNNINQSTTENISGVFKMQSGNWEYVMGYGIFASTKYGSSGFTDETFPTDSKYVDTYANGAPTNRDARILGDATGEMGPFAVYTSSWYNGGAHFVMQADPWFIRGRNGIFGFYISYYYGAASTNISFRVVIV